MLRLANLSDLSDLLDQAIDGFKENHPHEDYVADDVTSFLIQTIKNNLLFTLDNDTELLGSIGFQMSCPYYDFKKVTFTSWGLYLRPKFRSYRNLKALLQSAELLKPYGIVKISLRSDRNAIEKHKLFNRLYEVDSINYLVE